MEPSITSMPTSSVSQGTNHQQIDTGNVVTPRIGKKRNSSILSAPSSPSSSSSSKLHNDEVKHDTILSTGLREKRNSNSTSPKSSEEKHTDNYSVSTGNNSHDSVDRGGTIPDHVRTNLTTVPSSSSSSSSHQSSLEPLVHMTAPLGMPLGQLNSPSLRGAQKDYDPTKQHHHHHHKTSSPISSQAGKLPSLPMARGTPVRRLSGALNHSGKHLGGLHMSGKTVSIKGSFNSAYGETTTPHIPHEKHGYYGGTGIKEHKGRGTLRYNRFWDGVHAMIDIQNSTKLQSEMIKKETKKHLNDFERMRELYLIHPNGRFKMMWDMIAGLAIFYSVLQVPFAISFQQNDASSGIALALDFFVIAVFFADILCTFNTSFIDFHSDDLVTDRGVIAASYLKAWFWLDLVSSIPFDQIPVTSGSGTGAVRVVRVLRLLRLTRLFKLARLLQFQRLKEISQSMRVSVAVTNVVVLLLQLFIILHLVACFFFFLTTSYATGIDNVFTPSQMDDPIVATSFTYDASTNLNGQWAIDTWATVFEFQLAPVFSQYVAAMYWSFFTLFGVGFGDIHAVNTGERFFSVMVMLIGTVFQGAIISKVSRVIKSNNLLMRAVDEKMAELKVYLDDKKVPHMVKLETEEAYAYYLQRRPQLLELGTFHSLPKSMLYKLIHQAFDKEMQQVRMFRMTDIAFVANLVTYTIPFHCKVGDVLYDVGDVAEEMTFLSKGTVRLSVTDNSHESTVGFVTSGGYFGDFEFTARHGMRLCRYQAVQASSLLSLEYGRIRKAMVENPEIGEKFQLELSQRYKVYQYVRRAVADAAKDLHEEAIRQALGQSFFQKEMEGKEVADVSSKSVMSRESQRSVDSSPFLVASRAALEAGGGGSAENSQKRMETKASGDHPTVTSPGPWAVEDLNGSTKSHLSVNPYGNSLNHSGVSGNGQGVMNSQSVSGNHPFHREGVSHEESAGEHKHLVTPAQLALASEEESARLKVMVKPLPVVNDGGSHHVMAVPHHLPPISTTSAVGSGLASGPGLTSGPGLGPPIASGPPLARAPTAPTPGIRPPGLMMRQGSMMSSVFGGGPSQKSTTGRPVRAPSPEGGGMIAEGVTLSAPAPAMGPPSRQSSLARGMSQAFLGLRKSRATSVKVNLEKAIFRPTIWMDGEVKRYADQAERTKHEEKIVSKFSDSGVRYPMITRDEDGEFVIVERTLMQLKRTRIMHPRDPIKMAWDAMLGCIIIYSICMVPMQTAFTDAFLALAAYGNLEMFDYCIDCLFFIDIVLNFNTAYYNDAREAYVIDRHLITANYLFSFWFPVDVISSIPIDTFVGLASGTYQLGGGGGGGGGGTHLRAIQLVKIVRLLRLAKLVKLLQTMNLNWYLYRLQDMLHLSTSSANLIFIVCQVMFIAHLVTCAWWGVCTIMSTNNYTWYDDLSYVYHGLRNAAFQDQYVASLYFMFTTLSTTGYGDMVPVDDYERIVLCFIMMLAATVVAFIVANVTTVVDSANKHETISSDRITEVTEFLREKNCSGSLMREIVAHYTQVFKNETQYDEEVILARLPPIVRNKVLLAEYKAIFETIPLFHYIPNVSLRVHLLRRMHAHVCHKGRQIIKEGEHASEITFMVQGHASICKVLNTVYERKSGALRRIKTEDEKQAEAKEIAFSMHGQTNKMANLVVTTGALEGIFSPTTFQSPKNQAPGEKGTDNTVVGAGGAGVHGINTSTGAKNLTSPFHRLIPSEKTPLSLIPEDVTNDVTPMVPLINNNNNNNNNNDNALGGGGGGNGGLNSSTKTPSEGNDLRSSTKSQLHRKTSISSLLGSPFSKSTKMKPPLTEKQRHRAHKNWRIVRENLKLVVKMKRNQLHSSNVDRKITRVIIDNDDLGRPGYGDEQTQCEIEIIGDFLPGEFVGHRAMRRSQKYAYSAIAMEPCKFYTLRKNDILLMLRDEPDIALELQRTLSYAIRNADRMASKVEVRKKRTDFLKAARLNFKENNTKRMSGAARGMFSNAIAFAREQKAKQALEEANRSPLTRLTKMGSKLGEKLVKQVSFVMLKANDDIGEGGSLTTKMRIRLKKLSKTRLFSRKDGAKIQDYGSDSDDDDEVMTMVSGKKRDDETLPEKLRRLVRYEALFTKYLDAHDSDDETAMGIFNRQETLDVFIKRIKQERRALRESKLSAAKNLQNKNHNKPTSQNPTKSHVKVAVGVGVGGISSLDTPPSDGPLSSTIPQVNGSTNELDRSIRGELDRSIRGVVNSVLHPTHHSTPPKTSAMKYEEGIRRVRNKLFRRHKSHRSSDDLISLQKNAQRVMAKEVTSYGDTDRRVSMGVRAMSTKTAMAHGKTVYRSKKRRHSFPGNAYTVGMEMSEFVRQSGKGGI